MLPGTAGFLLSPSGLSMKGIIVNIGVTNEDYRGEIAGMILVSTEW